MKKEFINKLKEALLSTLPIIIIVLLLHFTKIVAISNKNDFSLFAICSLLLIVGMGLFTLGSDIAMTPMGEHVGEETIKSKKLWFAIFIVFIIGTLITIAEPDLTVLANQVPVKSIVLILTVSVGVGIFLVVSLLRIVFKINLRTLLVIFYSIVFIISIFANKSFLPLSFDSGGVTTGPVTVPFLMALGVGIASVGSSNKDRDDSFGMVALCSIGPILSVLILSLFIKDTPIYEPLVVEQTSNVFKTLLHGLTHSLKEIGIALLPILVFFYVFQYFTVKLPKKRLIRIFIGILYTYIGLSFFLCAVNVGFMPIGVNIGKTLAVSKYKDILVPLAFIMGVFVVLAEPAVHTLNKQVEEISGGTISKKAMMIGLSIGVGISLALSMIRIIFDFSVMWYLVPGYFIALILSFFVPKVYTSIAFDSGGVASGPMTAGFILPFAIGVCSSMSMDVMSGGFGIVAMVAMTPLITIQILGFSAVIKDKIRQRINKTHVHEENENQIINFND